jgi:FlaA1/EpsC-like NDP-sugar epimerase
MRKIGYDPYSSLNQRLIDATIAGISFYLAYQLRFNWSVPAGSLEQMWLLLPAIMLGRVLVNSALKTYRLVWRHTGLADAVIVARSCAVFSFVLLALRLWAPNRLVDIRMPLSIIVIEFLLSLEGSLVARALRRLLYERFSHKLLSGHAATCVLLVGAGQAGVTAAKEIASRTGVRPVGFVDDDPKKLGCCINGLHVLGTLNSLAKIVQEYRVREVLLCLARPPRNLLRTVWATCDHLGVRVKIIPTFEEIFEGKTNVAAFRDIEMHDLLGREPVTQLQNEGEVLAAYRGKRILITGAGGSIGSELAYQLAKVKPAQLVLLDKDENGLSDAYLRIGSEVKGVSLFPAVADIRFSGRLRSLFADFRPEVVFHAAAHKHVYLMEANPCEAILNNVVGTRNVVEKSVAFGVSRFVLISTDKAVRPTSIMGASKRVCEMVVQSQADAGQTRFCCVRFGNVLGSRGSVVPIFRKQIERGGPITVTHPEVRRYLMTIPEAVGLLIQAGTLGCSGETFVLEMGEPVLIQDLARDLIECSGLRPGRDIQIQLTRLRHGEKLNEILFDEMTEKLSHTQFEKIYAINGPAIDPVRFAGELAALEDAARLGSLPGITRILRELNIGFMGETQESQPVAGPAISTTIFAAEQA